MSRFKGHGTLNTTYDVNYWGPLDSRFLVSSKSDLYLESTWKPSAVHTLNCYNGMIVAVANDEAFEGIFCLTDMHNFDREDAWIQLDVKNGSEDTPSGSFATSIVDALPSVGQPNILYLVRTAGTSSSNRFTEYLWVENSFELIGSISGSTDLSNYYTKSQTDNVINSAISALRVELAPIGNVATKVVELDEAIQALRVTANNLNVTTTQHSEQISALTDSKVTRKYDDNGKEWSLISPSDQAKLSALVIDDDGNVGVSAKVTADNIIDLDQWITNNRGAVPGLLSDEVQTQLDAVGALMTNGQISATKIAGLNTWVEENKNSVDGLLSDSLKQRLDEALTVSNGVNISLLRQDVEMIILES